MVTKLVPTWRAAQGIFMQVTVHFCLSVIFLCEPPVGLCEYGECFKEENAPLPLKCHNTCVKMLRKNKL